MPTIGLLPSQQLATLDKDRDNNWINIPEGETVVPLVKVPKPTTSPGIDFNPKLVWFDDRVERQWEQTTLPIPIVVAPPAEAFQIRAFMIRNGIDPASIPVLIESATAAGPERDEALMRWEFVTRFPKTHPLVTAVAALLQLDLDQVWDSIIAIE